MKILFRLRWMRPLRKKQWWTLWSMPTKGDRRSDEIPLLLPANWFRHPDRCGGLLPGDPTKLHRGRQPSDRRICRDDCRGLLDIFLRHPRCAAPAEAQNLTCAEWRWKRHRSDDEK